MQIYTACFLPSHDGVYAHKVAGLRYKAGNRELVIRAHYKAKALSIVSFVMLIPEAANT